MKLIYQYMAIFVNFKTTSNHLHLLQVDSNSRLVVGEDDNDKFKPETVEKTAKIRIRGLAYAWTKGYLTNRKQFVSLNNATSSNKLITIGGPQGSFWGHY